MAGDARGGFLIFGVHRELLRRNFCKRAQNGGTTSRSVFIKVQTNFAGAALSWSFVGLTRQDRFADWQSGFHWRILTAFRCANSPSASAKVSAASANRLNPLLEISCTEIHFTKSAADSPPRRFAQPAVGSTWLLPVT